MHTLTPNASVSGLSCPLCGGQDAVVTHDRVADFEYGAPGSYAWVCCQGCGLTRLWPAPTPEILTAAYPPDYHAYQTPASKLTAALIHRSRTSLARRLLSRVPSGGTILDLGCSTGDLLAACGAMGDFRLLGVEYNPTAADAARQKGITVWQGELDEADFEAGSVDLVVMQHVLEHVFNPVSTLERVFSLLKPGGWMVGELPNLDSWDAAIFGRYWGGGHAPRHLWHFTPKTLRQAFAVVGFQDVALSPALHTGHWALSVQNALRRGRQDRHGLRNGRTWYYPFLLLVAIPVNALQMPGLKTGVMRFVARKPL